jgi:hypothetical protein
MEEYKRASPPLGVQTTSGRSLDPRIDAADGRVNGQILG